MASHEVDISTPVEEDSFKILDTDGNGVISLTDFCKFWRGNVANDPHFEAGECGAACQPEGGTAHRAAGGGQGGNFGRLAVEIASFSYCQCMAKASRQESSMQTASCRAPQIDVTGHQAALSTLPLE